MKKLVRTQFTVFLIMVMVLTGIGSTGIIHAKSAATSIKLNRTAVTLYRGQSFALKAAVKPNKAANKKVTFTSSNKKVAKVTKAGEITAIKKGTATIKVKTSNGISNQCRVTVKNRPLASGNNEEDADDNTGDDEESEGEDSLYYIDILTYKENMLVGTTQIITLYVEPENATNKSLVYTSSNSAVASISQSGLITALKTGTTRIQVAAAANSEVKSEFVLTVYQTPALNVSGATIQLGDSLQDLISKLGNPGRKEASYYGEVAYVYNSDYAHFIMVYLQADKVVGYYTDAIDFMCQGVGYNSSQAQNQTLHGAYSVKYYIDNIGSGLVNAVKVISDQAAINDLSGIMTSMEFQIFDLTNSIRVRNGLSPLVWSDLAAQSARGHSIDMAINNYFSHTGLDGSSLGRRLNEVGINWHSCGENIIAGYGDSTDSAFGWYQSSGHRNNMLNTTFTYLGVGGATGGSYGNYYTQNFYS